MTEHMPVSAEVLAAWEADVVLADGSTARVRPIRPDDRDRLERFHGRQSPESIYFRYFRFRPELTEKELDHFTTVDYAERMAFVAVRDDELIAVARYEPWSDRNEAEVAFFVDDAHGGRGLATLLLEFLAAAGRRHGLDGFTATVLPENYGMLRVFRKAGFEVSTRFADGVIEVALGIDVTDDAEAAIHGRARAATARSVARVIEPSSIAVIGPSRRPDSVGYELLRQLQSAPFEGPLHVVHPEADEILGITPVRSIADLAEPPDLAIVVTPSQAVEQVVEECVAAGAGALLVISAGFSEVGDAGADLERRLVSMVREGGVRMVGPNSFGLANTDPDISLRALFVPVEVPVGRVGLLSQSGPLGAGLLADLARAGVGVSSFAALGNRADVSVNDMLQYWAEDERTGAIALYLENFGNLRSFTAIARQVGRIKPIMAVATGDDDVNQMLEQSGVMLVDQVSGLADQARLSLQQPFPSGKRVTVVSNTSSVARLAVAACRRNGLEVVGPDDGALLVGDVDHLAAGSFANLSIYERTLVSAALSDKADAIVVALVPSLDLSIQELRELLVRVDRAVAKPVVAIGLEQEVGATIPGISSFTFPEPAAAILGRATRHGEWLHRASSPTLLLDREQHDAVRGVIDELLGSDPDEAGRTLTRSESDRLLAAIGIDGAPSIEVAASTSGRAPVEQALAAAEQLGYPVAIKAAGLAMRSAGETGGTALDVHTPDDLAESVQRMHQSFGTGLDPLVIQAMVPTGLHLRVELGQDFEHGSSLRIGPGGASARLSRLAERRALPTSRVDLARTCNAPWLRDLTTSGERSMVLEVLAKLAAAAASVPELAQIRLDPILVSAGGATAVDGTVTLRPWATDILDGLRRL